MAVITNLCLKHNIHNEDPHLCPGGIYICLTLQHHLIHFKTINAKPCLFKSYSFAENFLFCNIKCNWQLQNCMFVNPKNVGWHWKLCSAFCIASMNHSSFLMIDFPRELFISLIYTLVWGNNFPIYHFSNNKPMIYSLTTDAGSRHLLDSGFVSLEWE